MTPPAASSDTLPADPPWPPSRPIAMDIVRAGVLPSFGVSSDTDTEELLPPPLPTDCASKPYDASPCVVTVPLEESDTSPADPPVPPMRPIEIPTFPPSFFDTARSKPTLPPPPPIDCASTPNELLPHVSMRPWCVTSTVPPLPPSPG